MTTTYTPHARSIPAALKHSLGVISAALLLSTTAIPRAQALTFGDGNNTTNPFFFNGSSTTSSWTLDLDGSPQNGWGTGDSTPCDPEKGLCVSATSTSSAVIAGSGDPNTTTSWTSAAASTPYFISFDWEFAELSDNGTSTPFYTINGITTNLVGTIGSINSVTLNGGSTLTFGITNVDGFGDLTISNFDATFDATPVPAPLPLLGAAATFGWIRKRRAQLKARQLRR